MIVLLIGIGIVLSGRTWLASHPEHNPWAPLDLRDPVGWTTSSKMRALRENVQICRDVLERSEVDFVLLGPAGEGPCRRPDRTRLQDFPATPDTPAVTCELTAALHLWQVNTLNPLASSIFGSEIERVEHLGAYSCRRLYGRSSGRWSEHATANALDISGFSLENGTRISVEDDWSGEGGKTRFLREVRNGGCDVFSTVLSPDYNAAHSDHFHVDMSSRWTGVCR